MIRYRFEILLGACLAALFTAFYLWQNPGLVRAPISPAEADAYAAIAAKVPLPAEEKDLLIARFRDWLAHDDGRPVFMLNLMRYYKETRPYPGAPAFAGNPMESNAHYEDVALPLLAKQGGYVPYGGTVHDKNIMVHDAELDDWSRVLIVRYPSRRAFAELLTDPAYAPAAPYKLMALKVALVPTREELVMAPLTQVLGALFLLVFLATGWWRACRRAAT